MNVVSLRERSMTRLRSISWWLSALMLIDGRIAKTSRARSGFAVALRAACSGPVLADLVLVSGPDSTRAMRSR